jgi:type I restriction enzyme S subunit
MGLNKYRLGDFIERSTANNRSLKYKEDLIVGVTSDGVFSTPKGSVNGVDLTPYKIVSNGDFVYNPSRFDLGSIAYRTEGLCIVSHLYQIFHLNEKGKEKIDPIWLFIYLRRKEFRREVTFRNFGSQRPEFNFNDLSEIVLPLPSIQQQRKYVDVYLALQSNLAVYQSKADELKLVCDGYIDQLKVKIPKQKIGNLLETVDKRNSELTYTGVQGININKTFFPTVANIDEGSTRNYKVVEHNQFAFSGMQTGRDMCIRIALNEESKPVIISPAYTVFRIKDDNIVLSHYIMLWFSRKQIDRYGWFASDGSIRSNLDLERFFEMEIPIPNISVQRQIVNIHKCYIERQRIANALKEQLKNICPVLIRGSLEEKPLNNKHL